MLMSGKAPGSLGNRLLWFVLIWAASVAVVAGGARLLQWLVFTP